MTKMERLKRTFSFRKSKRKPKVPESSKPHQWQEDERKVREGTCSFQVRYLGCIEVFESRGMQVCEEAVKALKASCKKATRLSFRRKRKGHKALPAILYISGDSLRVVEDRGGSEIAFKGFDDPGKGLIVDQTIEKVSFCAPDRNHEKGFAYICRDGTTRRWMCHGFLALKESGERLSHAVGCAFAICLERKQKRDKDSGVTAQFSEDGTTFTRTGSFRQTTLTERLADPQSAIIPEPVQSPTTQAAVETHAVQRPRASEDMLMRQGSFRGFSKLQETSSPFKRQLSLRLNELPSTLQRQQEVGGFTGPAAIGPASPIAEVSPTKEKAEETNMDSIAAMCQELSSGLSALNTDDPFAIVPKSPTTSPQHIPNQNNIIGTPAQSTPVKQNSQEINPWTTSSTTTTPSADFWLNTSLSQVGNTASPVLNGNTAANMNSNFQAGSVGFHAQAQQQQRPPSLGHARSHSIDTSDLFSYQHHQQRKPTLSEIARQNTVQNGAALNSSGTNWQQSSNVTSLFDPFDAAWAKATAPNVANTSTASNTSAGTNPFAGQGSTKAFEVKL